MPKKETEHIQNRILKLGADLGFISVKEESLHGKDHYAPEYDVVWYLDLKKWYKLDGIGELLKNAPKEMFERIKRLPFAGFEIEGPTQPVKIKLATSPIYTAAIFCTISQSSTMTEQRIKIRTDAA